jgi:cytochrome c oxidase assembly protein subunit 15
VALLRRLAASRLSPDAYRRITFGAVVLLVLIVVTGGAVRLTGSGLGCTDWPTCENNRIIAPGHFHAWMEFGNRLVTGGVAIAVIIAVLGALVRVPRRRDLLWLAVGEVVGVIGQIVLGGLVVLFHLWPPLVMSHFVISQLLVLDALVLHHRAGRPDGFVTRPDVDHRMILLGRLLVGLAALAMFTGTIVTGAGPHSGSNGNDLVKRLPLDISSVARLHGVIDMTFVVSVLAFVVLAHRTGAAERVYQRAELVLAVGILQAGIGYTQYFTGVPELLVGLHILGATVLWITVLWLHLGLFTYPSDQLTERVPGPADSRGGRADHHRTGADLVTQ